MITFNRYRVGPKYAKATNRKKKQKQKTGLKNEYRREKKTEVNLDIKNEKNKEMMPWIIELVS